MTVGMLSTIPALRNERKKLFFSALKTINNVSCAITCQTRQISFGVLAADAKFAENIPHSVGVIGYFASNTVRKEYVLPRVTVKSSVIDKYTIFVGVLIRVRVRTRTRVYIRTVFRIVHTP